MSKNYLIDLSKYKNDEAKFIVGRDNGYKARKTEELDKLVEDVQKSGKCKIEFVISDDIYGVVSSFILGMLSEIVSKINNKERAPGARGEITKSEKRKYLNVWIR